MAYISSVDLTDKVSSFGVYFGKTSGAAILFSDIFSGSPQYYAGSVIQVQEIATIYTAIKDSSLVDVDYGWWEPKQYLGTYQLTNGLYGRHREGDDGYLVGTIQEISRYSWYTITANPDTPIARLSNSPIEDCNFFLQPDVYLPPGEVNPVTGFKFHNFGTKNPALYLIDTIARAPLADTPFFPLITDIGVHLRPGVSGLRADYTATIINDIFTDYPGLDPQTCSFTTGDIDPCTREYNQLTAKPPELRNYYTSLGECEAQIANRPPDPTVIYKCISRQFVCSTDPAFVRDGYQIAYYDAPKPNL